jgi:hypothetical protein
MKLFAQCAVLVLAFRVSDIAVISSIEMPTG